MNCWWCRKIFHFCSIIPLVRRNTNVTYLKLDFQKLPSKCIPALLDEVSMSYMDVSARTFRPVSALFMNGVDM